MIEIEVGSSITVTPQVGNKFGLVVLEIVNAKLGVVRGLVVGHKTRKPTQGRGAYRLVNVRTAKAVHVLTEEELYA